MDSPGKAPALSDRTRSFWRAAALAGVAAVLSPLSSSLMSPIAMVGIPAGAALIAFQWRRRASLGLAVGLLLVSFAGAFGSTEPLWLIERAWALLLAGGYVVATALGPRRPVLSRGLAALLVAGGVVAVSGALRPGSLGGLDWRVAGQFDRVAMLFDLQGDTGSTVADAVRSFADVAKVIYPGLLGLASLAALAVTEYVTRRMEGVEAAVAPLREFRFGDHLAWALVAGLLLLILPTAGWATRTGANVVTFMSGLYILRGAGVLAWLGTSVISSGWSVALWSIAAILFYPVTLGTAFVLGLSDTWLDLRTRLGVEAEEE